MKAIRIFLLVLIIIGVGLLATQKIWVPILVNKIVESEIPQPPKMATTSVKTTPTPTAKPVDQKFYADKQYGFRLQFPLGWEIQNEAESNNLNLFDTTQKNPSHGSYRLILSISPEKADSIESWFEKNIIPAYRMASITPTYKDFTINGLSARELPIAISEGGCDRGVAISHDGIVFNIRRNGGTCDYDNNVIDSVISSFKFGN